MSDKRQNQPVDRHAAQRKAREERLAAALRANLKRRKAAPGTTDTPAEDGAVEARSPGGTPRTRD